MVRDGDVQRQEKEVRLDGLGVRWEMGDVRNMLYTTDSFAI